MALIQILVLTIALYVGYHIISAQRLRIKASRLGCQPAPRYKHWDPIFGLDLFLRTGKVVGENNYLVDLDERYKTYGDTYEALNFGKLSIHTIHPENLRVIYSQNAADWGVQPLRLANMHSFCGSGFITTDGPEWERSRALLKPGFNRANVSDFAPLDRHLQQVFDQIPEDGKSFDLQQLIFNLYLDLNSQFLFGEPLGILAQKGPPHAVGFLDAFQSGFGGCGMRIAFGPLKFILPTKPFLAACEKVHHFTNIYVDRALAYRRANEGVYTPKTQPILLYSLAQKTSNRIDLRNQIIQTLMAAQETTAALISNVFFLLSRHPIVYQRLRAEVTQVTQSDEPLDFARLSQISYLQAILKETLRLHPVFPQNNRVALRDTILPLGGGLDGKSPIFCPAGTLSDSAFSSLHRSKAVYGPSADDFYPERWVDIRPETFEYVPFGAGPRACLGQLKASMEAAYIIVRFAQRYREIRSEDAREWQCKFQLTAKNVHGCKVSLVRA